MRIILVGLLTISSALFASESANPKMTDKKLEGKIDREITLVSYEIGDVKQWLPGFFKVKKGELVSLKLINKAKGPHGFAIDGIGIQETINENETKFVKFRADKKGLFQINCQLHIAHVGGQLEIE
jgi:nitrosocyanin